MKTRALIAAFALSAIVLGSGVSAFAYNGYHNYGNHAGMYAVSPEKQGAYDAMMKDYYSRVSPIQDKLNAKGIELDALSRNPNAKPETISKLANEVAELRSQLRAERMTLGDKMEKELGVQPGRGMMGNGMGYHNGGRHGDQPDFLRVSVFLGFFALYEDVAPFDRAGDILRGEDLVHDLADGFVRGFDLDLFFQIDAVRFDDDRIVVVLLQQFDGLLYGSLEVHGDILRMELHGQQQAARGEQ